MKLSTYLDTARSVLHLTSDNALAAMLGLSRGQLSSARKGERPLPNYAIFRLAQAINDDPARLIADLEADTDHGRRAFWEAFANQKATPETQTAPDREPSEEEDVVAKRGIEPRTRGFSVRCSTN